MKLNLGEVAYKNRSVIIEGDVQILSKSGVNNRIYLPDGRVGSTIQAGTFAVGQLVTTSENMKEKGFKDGDLIAYSYMGKEEWKHEFLPQPIIIIPDAAFLGHIELDGINDNPSQAFYEAFVPAVDGRISRNEFGRYVNTADSEWSGGRDMTSIFNPNATKLVF